MFSKVKMCTHFPLSLSAVLYKSSCQPLLAFFVVVVVALRENIVAKPCRNEMYLGDGYWKILVLRVHRINFYLYSMIRNRIPIIKNNNPYNWKSTCLKCPISSTHKHSHQVIINLLPLTIA